MNHSTSNTFHAASDKLMGPISMRGDYISSYAPKAWWASRFIAVVLGIITVFLTLGSMANGNSLATTINGLLNLWIGFVFLRLFLMLIRICIESAVVVSKLRE